ncbi:TMEM14-domain-containing protein [Neoconidiobolus thromboides FSU 785]|nr:TMEM14-domain-containing protein [Neoconidiobolus thromboides FSU 785]
MDYLGYAYAAIVAIGGSIGYIKAGSVPSLSMGLTFGGLLAYAANRVSKNQNDVYLSLALSLILLVVMGLRFSNSGKFMPAGLISALSLLMSIKYSLPLLK